MFSYSAYGLGIHADVSLPELPAGDVPADVTIRLGKVEAPSQTTGGFQVTPAGIYCSWRGWGSFLVRDGREIVVEPAADVDAEELHSLLLGPLLAILLHQRGLLVLHASTVAVAGKAAAFLAPCGQGKSTLAASIHAHGHALVADDLTVVQGLAERPLVFPGAPRLRLRPDATLFLGRAPEDLPRAGEGIDKRVLTAGERFDSSPLPLRRLYVIAEDTLEAVEPVPPGQAFGELLQHTYTLPFLGDLGGAHFRQCAALAKRVPVRRLKRRRSLALIPELIRLVEEDLARDG